MRMPVSPRTTALVILVPEAEPLVEPFRSRYDPVAPLGMPPHVTLLFPFLAADDLTEDALKRLRERLEGLVPFEYEFRRIGTFPGVLYMEPEDDRPFLKAMGAVRAAFPGLVPYGDPHLDPKPHLTVAHATDEAQLAEILASFEQALAAHGPVRGAASEATLMRHSGSEWSAVDAFEFGTVSA
jgi:2'-5' RNA ligase